MTKYIRHFRLVFWGRWRFDLGILWLSLTAFVGWLVSLIIGGPW